MTATAWYARGPRGAGIQSGAGAPSPTVGADGDLYLNTTNGDLYERASGAWTVSGNVAGPTGRGYTGITVAGDDLKFAGSDGVTDTVTVPAIASAAESASAASTSAEQAASSAAAAADSAADISDVSTSITTIKADLATVQARMFRLDATVYVADNTNGRVYQLLPDGTQSTLAITGLTSPTDVALDSAGVLYIGGSKQLVTFDPATGTQTTVASVANNIGSVTVDAADNVYFTAGLTVYKLAGGVQTTVMSNADGVGFARSVAVDNQGSIYCLDSTNLTVWKKDASGAVTELAFTGLSNPNDIAVDEYLNVYVADFGVGDIFMMDANGTQSDLSWTLAADGRPFSITFDGYGNMYGASMTQKKVYRFDRAGDGTAVGFDNTSFGSLTGVAVAAVLTGIPNEMFGMTIDGGKA